MEITASMELARSFLLTLFQLVVPLLLISLGVALLFGVLQAVTQIQEQALGFLAKLGAFVLTLYYLGPWMFEGFVTAYREYMNSLM